jgi:hypothetical protein
MSNITYVTGLWDIKRGDMNNDNYNWNRSFDTYLTFLDELLSTNLNFIVYGDSNLKQITDKHVNCKFVLYTLDDIKQNLPLFDKINNIRTSPAWYNQPNARWLKSSPQATLEYFNPVVMSKLLLLNKSHKLNPFNSSRLYWIDAGIIRTHNKMLFNDTFEFFLNQHEKFLFMIFKYINNTEIHGFLRSGMSKHCGVNFVDRLSRAQFFGGIMADIDKITDYYLDILTTTINEGYLGTEESLFTILTYKYRELFDTVEIQQQDGINTLLSLY